ncbi:MAG: GxxExxY protein [Spirochaetales bacterium]|nr:GxxExxY protein [Spirochaetales bacterium]
MTENELSKIVVDLCIKIHSGLGPGLFESVYETVLSFELDKMGIAYQRQVSIPVIWDGKVLDAAFRADIIVEKKLIIELKSLEKTNPVHKKQVITYLKLSGLKLGLLVNFGEELMRTGITRLLNGELE